MRKFKFLVSREIMDKLKSRMLKFGVLDPPYSGCRKRKAIPNIK